MLQKYNIHCKFHRTSFYSETPIITDNYKTAEMFLGRAHFQHKLKHAGNNNIYVFILA